MKTHVVSDDRKIHVFDNAVDYKAKLYIYKFLRTLSYKCINFDLGTPTGDHEAKLRCDITAEMEAQLKFFESIQDEECKNMLKNYRVQKMYVNMGIPVDFNEIHTDIGASVLEPDAFLTLLYYANPEWNINWGGETIFYNRNLDEVEFTSQFVPGRIVMFDQAIPHAARTQCFDATSYRFTVACKLQKVN